MSHPVRHGCLALVFALTATALAPCQAATTRTREQQTAASSQQMSQRERQAFRKQQNAARAEQRTRRMAEARRRRAAQDEIRSAHEFRRLQLPGDELRPRVEKLVGQLDWQDSLGQAQKVAQSSGKPIVWIHALGDLSGVL